MKAISIAQAGLRRRAFLAGGGALATPMLGIGGARAEDVRLRAFWWGSQDRARRTEAVARLFEQRNPGIRILAEAGGADYFPKLVTQISGGNAPDVFQTEPNSMADFARRGTCLQLDPLIPKPLDITGFGKDMLDLCAADGKIWGVGLGLNSFSMFYDADLLQANKLPAPGETISWQAYADLAVALTKAANRPGFWGSADGSRYVFAFEVWLRQRGSRLFTEDGKLGFKRDDAQEWFAYWADMRQRGGCVPPDIAAMDQVTIDSNALTLGKSGMTFAYSNQMIGFQQAVKLKLGISMYPAGAGTKPGQYYRAGLIWNIAKTSRHSEQAAAFINFFVNDLDAGKILGVERGVPLSPKVRAFILPMLNPVEKATVDYVNYIADKLGGPPPSVPRGANQFDQQVMRPVADLIAFRKLSVADGARKLIDDGNDALG